LLPGLVPKLLHLVTSLASKHLLLIGGTGRAGSSFLVQYLTKSGLDTSLARQSDAAFWDENAHAGLEEFPRARDFEQMPYVVKTTWLHEIIDAVLADPNVTIDAVIIPVRRLHEAAISRVVIQLRDLYETVPCMLERDAPFATWSTDTAGGCLTSLDPIDQARLLATGFHRLIERLVEAEVPMVFMAFPRFAQDADYAFQKLAPFLPGIDLDRARAIHASLADPGKIRVADEMRQPVNGRSTPMGQRDQDLLDKAALRRELERCRRELETARRLAARPPGARMVTWAVSLAGPVAPLSYVLTEAHAALRNQMTKFLSSLAAWKTAGS
jgi:hypothetical protein